RFYSLIRSLAFLTFSFLPGCLDLVLRAGQSGAWLERCVASTGVRIQLVKMPLIHRLYVKM
ncbi:hypothetical protein K469DRAFT_699574, partial [Zopfia rhizophila CBS 207.26]